MTRVQLYFLLKICDGFLDLRLEEMNLPGEKVRQRKFRINSQRFLRVFERHGLELLPEEHACGQEITARGFRLQAEHPGERLPSMRIVLGLEIALTQNIGCVHVGPRKP